MLAIAPCEQEEERASPVFQLILEEHKNMLSPRRLCVCLRNTSLKLVMNSADLIQEKTHFASNAD